MSDVIIRVSDLAKQYRIGQGERAPYQTLRESLVRAAKAPLRLLQQGGGRGKNLPKSSLPTIWALQEVSLEVKRGDVLGIIGRNGAGKTTLLKILSRVTPPTRGMVDLYGRVGSLMEVGTGFHPELTGRENIYLNGAILGMRKAEIERKFDEIVAFSELEKFIDTPVKFYSTGMYMRLAFSVAAHLEPEILLVDEVLAVGDANFQKKCLGKISDVAGKGRTVLFVSHQMNVIQELCSECVWLDQGKLVERGSARQVVSRYLSSGITHSEWIAPDGDSSLRSIFFNPTRFCIVDKDLHPIIGDIQADEGFGVLLEGWVEQVSTSLDAGFAVYSATGELLFWAMHTDQEEKDWPKILKGKNKLIAWIPPHLLNEGSYRLDLLLLLHYQEWLCQPGVNAPSLRVDIRGGLSKSPHWMRARPGLIAPHIRFEALE